MIKKVTIILTIITMLFMTNYVCAKYIEENYIHIAEVNIEKIPIKRKKYVFKVYYIDLEANNALKICISSVYDGEMYEAEILDFPGYTYSYADKPLSAIMKKNISIYLYYEKDTTEDTSENLKQITTEDTSENLKQNTTENTSENLKQITTENTSENLKQITTENITETGISNVL